MNQGTLRMRSRTFALLGVASLLSSAAMATSTLTTDNIGFTCSDTLSLDDVGGFVVGCVGDLQVQGSGADALLSHGTSITLRATSSLTLKDLRVVAPSIVLEAPQITVSIGVFLDNPVGSSNGQVVLNAHTALQLPAGIDPNRVTIGTSGSLDIAPGSNIQVTNHGEQDIHLSLTPASLSVPEPTSWALMLAGVAGLFGLRRTRRR